MYFPAQCCVMDRDIKGAFDTQNVSSKLPKRIGAILPANPLILPTEKSHSRKASTTILQIICTAQRNCLWLSRTIALCSSVSSIRAGRPGFVLCDNLYYVSLCDVYFSQKYSITFCGEGLHGSVRHDCHRIGQGDLGMIHEQYRGILIGKYCVFYSDFTGTWLHILQNGDRIKSQSGERL